MHGVRQFEASIQTYSTMLLVTHNKAWSTAQHEWPPGVGLEAGEAGVQMSELPLQGLHLLPAPLCLAAVAALLLTSHRPAALHMLQLLLPRPMPIHTHSASTGRSLRYSLTQSSTEAHVHSCAHSFFHAFMHMHCALLCWLLSCADLLVRIVTT